MINCNFSGINDKQLVDGMGTETAVLTPDYITDRLYSNNKSLTCLAC